MSFSFTRIDGREPTGRFLFQVFTSANFLGTVEAVGQHWEARTPDRVSRVNATSRVRAAAWLLREWRKRNVDPGILAAERAFARSRKVED